MSQRRAYGADGRPTWIPEGGSHAHARDRFGGYGAISGWWLTTDQSVPPEDTKALAELRAAAERGRAAKR